MSLNDVSGANGMSTPGTGLPGATTGLPAGPTATICWMARPD